MRVKPGDLRSWRRPKQSVSYLVVTRKESDRLPLLSLVRNWYVPGTKVFSGGAMIGDEAVEEGNQLFAGFGQNKGIRGGVPVELEAGREG